MHLPGDTSGNAVVKSRRKSRNKEKERRRLSLFSSVVAPPASEEALSYHVTFEFPVDEPFETCDERDLHLVNQPTAINKMWIERGENQHARKNEFIFSCSLGQY